MYLVGKLAEGNFVDSNRKDKREQFYKSQQYRQGLAELDRTKGAVMDLVERSKGEDGLEEKRDAADALFADDELYYDAYEGVDGAGDFAYAALGGSGHGYDYDYRRVHSEAVQQVPYSYSYGYSEPVRGYPLFAVGVVVLMLSLFCSLLFSCACFSGGFMLAFFKNQDKRMELSAEEDDEV